MKPLVCIPTYNEIENIPSLVKAIKLSCPEVSILVIDDNSPDGTAAWVKNQTEHKDLNLLWRPQKQGLGRAYIEGFKWGIERNFDPIIEMDADFSHRPEDLKELLKAAHHFDFAVGSRYVAGGRTENWGLIRKLISRGGSIYARLILGFPINDWTGGFNLWRSNVLKKIDLDSVKSNGYSFQIELKYKASKNHFKGTEVPILFADRRVGQSKMSVRIMIEALYRVWLLRFNSKYLNG